MQTMKNPQPQNVKLTIHEMVNLSTYIINYIDDFNKVQYNNDINIVYCWHFNEIYTRLENKIVSAWSKDANYKRDKLYNFKINHIERKILSLWFQRYPNNEPFFLVTQEKIIKGLIKIKTHAA